MKLLSISKPTTGLGRLRSRLLLSGLLAALALGVTASSAAAFGWWIGKPPRELKLGERLPINPVAKVTKPFTLEWFEKAYDVSCAAATYNGLYLEGTVFLGATGGISFEKCTVKKPAGTTIAGGDILTAPLRGEIKPAAEGKVEFEFFAEDGAFAQFTLEAGECTYPVTILGTASGDLSKATKITTEKSFDFDSTRLSVNQTKECISPASGGTTGKEKKKKKHKEEGEGAVEKNTGNTGYSATEGWGVPEGGTTGT